MLLKRAKTIGQRTTVYVKHFLENSSMIKMDVKYFQISRFHFDIAKKFYECFECRCPKDFA